MAEHKIDLKVELDTSKAKSDFDNLTNMMKNVKPIKIDIGDSVGNINKLKTALEALGKFNAKGFSKINKELDSFSKSMKNLSSIKGDGFKQINNQIKNLTTNMSNISKLDDISFSNVNKQIKNMTTSLEKMNTFKFNNLESLNKVIGMSEKTISSMTSAGVKDFSSFAKSIDQVTKSMEKISKTNLNDIKKMGTLIENVGKGFDKAFVGDNVSKGTAKLREMANVLQEINKLDSATKKQVMGSNIVSDVQKESKARSEMKSLLNEELKIRKQLMTSTNDQSTKALASNLKEVQKALNGMSINKSASHMRSLTQSMAKEFQSIQTKAQSMKTQLEKALKIDKNVANIQGFKDIYKELQNISNFKIDFNSDLAERDIANLNSKLKELETKTKSLNIDVKSTGKFDKLQNEIDSLDRKIKELRDNQIDFDVDDSELKEAERLLDKLKGYKLGNIDAGGWKQIDTDIGNCNKSIKNYSSEVKKASKASDSGASSGFKWAKNLNDALSTYTPIYMASRLLTSATEGTVQSIIDLDSAFRDIAKVAPDSYKGTREEMRALKQDATEVANAVGKTTVEALQGTASAFQLGIKNTKDALTYAKNINMFSNVGDMTVEEADNQMKSIMSSYGGVEKAVKAGTSAVKGANKEYSLMTEIMDGANWAGNNYAVTAGDMTTALSKFANVASTNGVPAIEAMSYALGAQETIQDASKVGNGLKTIMTNLTGLKTSAKDGSIGLNKTAKALKNVGIDVLDSSGNVRDMTEIMDELGNKWDTLSKKDRLALGEAIAGKTQLNVLNGMMNNWDKIKKFQTEYKQGMMVGSSEKENARYIDSIEGKITKLKNNIANLATTIFSSNMFKGLLDGANAFIEGLTKIFSALDKVHLALPTVIAGFLAFKSVIGALAGEKGGGATVKAIEGIGKAIGAISKEGSVIGGLSSTLSGAFTSMGASASVASAGVTLLSGGLAILGTMLVGGAIYKGMEYLSNHYKRVGDASRTRQEEIKGEIQAIQQQAGSLSQIAGRYDELNRKVKRTKSEEKELKNLRQQIAEISPDLVAGYTAQGDPILKLNGSLKNTIKLMERQAELQQKILMAERENESYANYKDDQITKKKLESQKKQLEDQMALANASRGYDTKDWSTPTSKNGDYKSYRKNLKEQEKAYSDYINKINGYNAQLSENSAKAQQLAFDRVTSNDKYLKQTEKAQGKINSLVSGFEWGNLSPEKQQSVANALTKVNKKFGESGYNVDGFNQKISNLSMDYATGSISQERYMNMLLNYAKDIKKETGIDVPINDLVTALDKIPPSVSLADKQLGAFLKANGKKTSQIGIDVETTNLVNARDTVTSAIDNILASIESNKDKKVSIDVLTEINNEADLPVQLSGAIDAILADGKVDVKEQEILIDLLTKWQETGEVDREKLEELMSYDGKQVTPEIRAKVETEGFETVQTFLDKDVGLEKTITANMKVEGYGTYKEAMDKAGNDKDKQTEIKAVFEAQGQEVMDSVFSLMDELGLSNDNSKKEFMTTLKTAFEKEGMTPADIEDTKSFADYLQQHPNIRSMLGIEVDKNGKVNVDQVEDAMEKLDGKTSKSKVEVDGADEAVEKMQAVDKNGMPVYKPVNVEAKGDTEVNSKLKTVDQNAKPAKKDVTTDDKGTTQTVVDRLSNLHDFLTPVTKGVTTTESGSTGVVSKLKSVDKNAKPVTKKAKATQTGAQQVVQWLQKINSQKGTKQHKTTATQRGCSSVLSAIRSIMSQPSTKTITTTFRKVTENITKFLTQGKKGGKGKSSLSAPEQVSKSAFDTEADLSTQTYESASIVTDTIADQVEDMVNDQQEAIQRSLPTMMFNAQAVYSGTSVSPSDGNNVLATIQFDVELFKELQDELKEIANQANVVNAQMENAFGTNKIAYLKQQISLLQTQSQLQARQLEYYKQEQAVLKSNLQSYGFAFNGEDITNYESLLLSKERELKRLEDISKQENATDAQKKAYEDYRDSYDKMKKVLQEYYEIESQGLYETQQAIAENTAKVREYQNEIEQLAFTEALRQEEQAIQAINMKLELFATNMEKVTKAKDKAYGQTKINLMNEEVRLLYEEISLNNQLKSQYESQLRDYQRKLSSYGATFDGDGTINSEQLLDRYANTADYEKLSKWVEEYNNLVKEVNDTNKEITSLTDNINELNTEVKSMTLDLMIEKFNAKLYSTNKELDKLNNKIDILDAKMKYTSGYEKLDILKQQIETYKQLQQEETIAINMMKDSKSHYESILRYYGAIIDKSGTITNLDSVYSNIGSESEREYFDKALSEWEDLTESITEAEMAILNYDNAIKDSMSEQLDITKEIEDKITQIYEKQIEDRKKALEEQTNNIKKELEKQKQAYNDFREQAEYDSSYQDKTAEIEKLKRDIARLEKDESLNSRKKLLELQEQLKNAEKDLSDLVQDKLDNDINDMFDDQIESVDQEYENRIKALENAWSDINIAEAVKNALGSGVFTDIDGNVRSLKDTMLEFAETSGEALGVMGDKVKNELVGNLQIALDTVQRYDEIMKGLDIEQMQSLTSATGTNSTTNNYSIGDTTFNIKSNDTEGIMAELKAYVDAKFSEIADGNR